MIEIVNLETNCNKCRLIYTCPYTASKFKYDIVFYKYNEDLDVFDTIYIYDINLNLYYSNREIYSYLNDPIINKLLKLLKEYICSNLHPIQEINCDKFKSKTKVSNDVKKLLLKCYQKENKINEVFKFSSHLENNDIDLNNSENISIICEYKNKEHSQIILELCSNRLENIKRDKFTLDTNVVICNKYHIYKWEQFKTNKNIKIVTTDSELNNLEDIKKYKMIILLDKVLLYFIELSKKKKNNIF
jgi:hypothetical protein